MCLRLMAYASAMHVYITCLNTTMRYSHISVPAVASITLVCTSFPI